MTMNATANYINSNQVSREAAALHCSSTAIYGVLGNVVLQYWDALVDSWPGNWLRSKVAESTILSVLHLAAALLVYTRDASFAADNSSSSTGDNVDGDCSAAAVVLPANAAVSDVNSECSKGNNRQVVGCCVRDCLSSLAVVCRVSALLHTALSRQQSSRASVTAAATAAPPGSLVSTAAAAAATSQSSISWQQQQLLPDYASVDFSPSVELLLTDKPISGLLVYALAILTYHPAATSSSSSRGPLHASWRTLRSHFALGESIAQQIVLLSGILQQPFECLLLPLLEVLGLVQHRRRREYEIQLKQWHKDSLLPRDAAANRTGSTTPATDSHIIQDSSSRNSSQLSSSTCSGRAMPHMQLPAAHLHLFESAIDVLLDILYRSTTVRGSGQQQQLACFLVTDIHAILHEISVSSWAPEFQQHSQGRGVIITDLRCLLPTMRDCRCMLQEATLSSSRSCCSALQSTAAAPQVLLQQFAGIISSLLQMSIADDSSGRNTSSIGSSSSTVAQQSTAGAQDTRQEETSHYSLPNLQQSHQEQQQLCQDPERSQRSNKDPVCHPAVQNCLCDVLSLLETALLCDVRSHQQQTRDNSSNGKSNRHDAATAVVLTGTAAGQLHLLQQWLSSHCSRGAATVCGVLAAKQLSKVIAQIQQQQQQQDQLQPPQMHSLAQQQQHEQLSLGLEQVKLHPPCSALVMPDAAAAAAWFHLCVSLLKSLWPNCAPGMPGNTVAVGTEAGTEAGSDASTSSGGGSHSSTQSAAGSSNMCFGSITSSSECRAGNDENLSLAEDRNKGGNAANQQQQQQLAWLQLMIQFECQGHMMQHSKQVIRARAAACLNSTTASASEILKCLGDLLLWPLLAARCCWLAGAWLQLLQTDLAQSTQHQQQQQPEHECTGQLSATSPAAAAASDQLMMLLLIVDLLPMVLRLSSYVVECLPRGVFVSGQPWVEQLCLVGQEHLLQIQQLMQQRNALSNEQFMQLGRYILQFEPTRWDLQEQLDGMLDCTDQLMNEMQEQSDKASQLLPAAGRRKVHRQMKQLRADVVTVLQQVQDLMDAVKSHGQQLQHIAQQPALPRWMKIERIAHNSQRLKTMLMKQQLIGDRLLSSIDTCIGTLSNSATPSPVAPSAAATPTGLQRNSSSGSTISLQEHQVENASGQGVHDQGCFVAPKDIQQQHAAVLDLATGIMNVGAAIWSLIPQQYCCNSHMHNTWLCE